MTVPALATGSGVRYLMVGGLCALTHNAVMIAGARFGLHYLASACISFGLVVAIGYGLHAAFTFERKVSIAAFARYALAMLSAYPLTILLLFLLCDMLRTPMLVASPLATVGLLAWNYAAGRWAIAHVSAANGRPGDIAS